VVGTVTGLRADDWGSITGRDWGYFLLTTAVLRPTQPPLQWVAGALNPGVKRPGREDDHSPPSSAEVMNA
jgi:hypothetical protein